jgi:two-component system CheB/CheR fusion protein
VDDGDTTERTAAARTTICDLVRERLGHDFSGHKEKTFFRRVHRRMLVVQRPLLEDYIAYLKD